MAGKIHRYEISEESCLLPGVGPFPEPDFWSNEVPIMAICNPYLRAGRKSGDWIFHVPKKNEVENGPEYQPTGLLKIDRFCDAIEIIENNSGEFNEEWIERFKIDIAHPKHVVGDLLNDSDTTAKRRVSNHLIGDPVESVWFGSSSLNIKKVANSIGINLGSFKGPEVSELSDNNADRLAQELKERLDEANGTPPNAVFDSTK